MLRNLWMKLVNQEDKLIGWFIMECLSKEELQSHYSTVKDLIGTVSDIKIRHKLFKILVFINIVMSNNNLIIEE